MPMMKFRVIAGSHTQLTGVKEGRSIGKRKYKKGDVLESPRDLCAIFPNKFERLPEPGASVTEPEPLVLRARYAGDGMWDVVNRRTNEKLNNEPLPREAAFAMADPDEEDLDAEAAELSEDETPPKKKRTRRTTTKKGTTKKKAAPKKRVRAKTGRRTVRRSRR